MAIYRPVSSDVSRLRNGPDYEVCGTWRDGFRLISTYMLAGGVAAARGSRMAEALIARHPDLLPRILGEVTEVAVADWFADFLEGEVRGTSCPASPP